VCAREAGLVEGLLLLSYPLHPPQRPDILRTAHFPGIQIPALFAHGTRDGFGSIAEMEAALKLVPARTELLTVSDAGHELITNRTRDELPPRLVRAFCSFVSNGVA
jgi:predicted alpha/beta-hydrolase family hydrolase